MRVERRDDAPARDELMKPRGAYVMGRNMFGPIRGAWEGDWRGWWGNEPPYHAPVFVLTHYSHDPIEMEGGTTFHFVSEGFDAALSVRRRWPVNLGLPSRVAQPRCARRSLRA
jgi:dihydrofolate reductase